jgi:hypothetical protein
MASYYSREWQERMSDSAQLRKPCAVCAQRFKNGDLQVVRSHTLDLTLLRNPLLPPHVHPNTYDFIALYAKGLHTPWEPGDIDICNSCFRSLDSHHRMPVDTIANFQYYA